MKLSGKITQEEVKEKTPERFWSKVKLAEPDKCWEWQTSKSHNGYGNYSVGRQSIRAHRYVFELIFGDFDKSLNVLHKCDNRACVNPNHLFSGTQKDNGVDMARKNRAPHPVGVKNGMCKLTEENVRSIKEKLASGMLQKEIAGLFGISRPTISMISTGNRWNQISSQIIKTQL